MSDLTRILDLEERRSTHKDGLWWWKAPIPPRLHRCKPWSCLYDSTRHVYWLHCACGATSREGWVGMFSKYHWLHKNARRDTPESRSVQ
jgi:hypothetical protein